MTRIYPSLEHAYVSVLRDVLDYGALVAPRGMPTRELMHASFTVADASRNLVGNRARNVSQAYAVAEFLWILLGRRDVRTIAAYNKAVAKYSDDGETFFGAYGPWVAGQLEYVVDTIRMDRVSRQAVMTIWQQRPPATKDVPCTVALQFLLRGDRLHAQAFMRSNDAWLGLPYDIFTFTRIQAYVAAALGVEVGRYTHTAGSLHLYERDWTGAEDAAGSYGFNGLRSPDLTYPYPATLPVIWTGLPNASRCSFIEAAPGVPEPWATYVGVLAWKLYGDRSFLRPPYDFLVPEQAAVPAIRAGEPP